MKYFVCDQKNDTIQKAKKRKYRQDDKVMTQYTKLKRKRKDNLPPTPGNVDHLDTIHKTQERK